MLKNNGSITVLEKETLEAQIKSDLRLYRGVPQKIFADNMKKGDIHIGNSINNVRGSGIYTTTSLDCARSYTDGTGEIITLAINKEAKVIEMSYLEQVILKMREMHPEEFKCTLEDDVLYGSMRVWIYTQMKNYFKDDYDKFLRGEIPGDSFKLAGAYMKKYPNYSEFVKNRKRYYKNKIAAIFYNFGLSAKLLGYDALHSVDLLRNFVSEKKEEYLILNAGALTLCK